ncbi:MAG TPA: transglycosylase SLT domain-containing protein [Bacteroidales bacterium]|nr:transglycosylase SLT domain-containing protein [Bacteroidales bacterium]
MVTSAQLQSQLTYAHQAGKLPVFYNTARTTGLPAGLLLAVASRETGIWTDPYIIATGGIGRDGKSVSIMQVNREKHPEVAGWNPKNDKKFVPWAAGYLKSLLDDFGNITEALDAYNAGAKAVRNALAMGLDADSVTTGGDYGTDVLLRMNLINRILQSHPEYAQARASGSGSHTYIWVGAGLFFVIGMIYLHETRG